MTSEQNRTDNPVASTKALRSIVNTEKWDIQSEALHAQCRKQLEHDGVVVLPGFLSNDTVATLCDEAQEHRSKAFYTKSSHNVFLTQNDNDYPDDHARNRQVESSKGCITTDQIPAESPLHTLYNSDSFRKFLCSVLKEEALHEYADDLSSINVHYAAEGQELGWHFDNSSFAITLLIQKPLEGGVFEYVKDLRNSSQDDMNLPGVAGVLDGKTDVETLSMEPGCLVLFRGRDSLHRVTPTAGDKTRILVVLAYNSAPGVSLSESARMTFYGRL